MNDFPKLSLDEILNGRTRAQQSVPICLKADVLAEIQELEHKLRNLTTDEDDDRMVPTAGADPEDLARRIRELEAEAEKYTINIRLQAVERSSWNAAVDRNRKEDLDKGTEDLDLNGLAEDMFPQMLVSPEMNSDQRSRFLSGLSEAQWEQIIRAIWDLNRSVTTVGKSVTASQVLTRSAGKQKRDDQ